MAGGFIGEIYTNMDNINQWGQSYGPQVLRAIVLMVVIVLVARVAGRSLKALLMRFKISEAKATTAITLMHVGLLSVMILVFLHLLGFNAMVLYRLVAMIVMLLLVAYILLKPYMPQVPFVVGNVIKAGNSVGTVQAITFLHTKLKTFDGKIVIIPNHKVLNDLVINYHANPYRRVDVEFFIRYGEDLDQVRATVLAAMAKDERVLQQYDPRVVVKDMKPGYVEMQTRFWVERKHVLVIKWAINEAIIKALAQAGVPMAAERLETIPGQFPVAPAGDRAA